MCGRVRGRGWGATAASAASAAPWPLLFLISAPAVNRAAAGGRQWGYGVVVSVFRKQAQDRQGVPESAAAAYVVDTLLCCSSSSSRGKQAAAAAGGGPPEPAALGAADAEMQASAACRCSRCGWLALLG